MTYDTFLPLYLEFSISTANGLKVGNVWLKN